MQGNDTQPHFFTILRVLYFQTGPSLTLIFLNLPGVNTQSLSFSRL
jgi:hypothetical protein